MQENLSQVSIHSQHIKIHPRLTVERRAVKRKRGTFFISLLLLICSLTGFFIFGSALRPYSFAWILIFMFMFAVVSIFTISIHGILNLTKQLSALERLEARRQAVLQDPHLFPVERLSADASALFLPFTLPQSARKTRLLGSFFMLIFPIILLVWGWRWYQGSLPTPGLDSFQLIASGGAVIIIMLMDIYRRYNAWGERLTLTEDGLILTDIWHKRRNIPWREANLFAFDGFMVRGKKSFTLLFELSSSNEAIYWEWVLYINTAILPQANQSFFLQGCDLQLEAILSLIAGRTGLPLHDLQEYKKR